MQSLLVAMELVADVGTNVVYVEPQWPNIHNVIHLVGARAAARCARFRDNDLRLDLDKLFARCDARTRAIFLSTPANPTGWVCSPRRDSRRLLEFSRKRRHLDHLRRGL